MRYSALSAAGAGVDNAVIVRVPLQAPNKKINNGDMARHIFIVRSNIISLNTC
jgi:hypothetical protein